MRSKEAALPLFRKGDHALPTLGVVRQTSSVATASMRSSNLLESLEAAMDA